jgi:hypothetical protein
MTDAPIRVQRTFPGNIGEGIIRDAAVNNMKKTIRIVPFVGVRPLLIFDSVFLVDCCPTVSSIAIFNKPCRIAVEQKYTKGLTCSKNQEDSVSIARVLD